MYNRKSFGTFVRSFKAKQNFVAEKLMIIARALGRLGMRGNGSLLATEIGANEKRC
jgi:hypothetical protein